MAEKRTSRIRSRRKIAAPANPKRSSAGTRGAQLQCFYPSGSGSTANAHIAKRSIAAASCGRRRKDPRIINFLAAVRHCSHRSSAPESHLSRQQSLTRPSARVRRPPQLRRSKRPVLAYHSFLQLLIPACLAHRRPAKETFSIMTHVRNTNDPKRHIPIVQAYKEQRRELETVHGAAQTAQKALKLAQGQLSQLQDQIDEIPGQSPAVTSTDAHPSITLIHRLGKFSIEKRLEYCGHSAAQNQTTADICDMEPADPGVYQRAAAKNEQPLNGPSTMRVDLVEAEPQISRVSQLRADYLFKTLRYEELRLLCKRMEAGIVQWALQHK
jgi:hypothetical protein